MLRKKSIFITLWTSYALILVIPVSIAFVLFGMMVKTLADNANRSNLALLEQVRQVTDAHLQEVDRMTALIAKHPKIQPLLMNEPDELDRPLQYVEAIRAMTNVRSSTNYVSDFYVHVSKDDVIVGPDLKADTAMYFNSVYPLPGMALDQVRSKLLSGYHFKSFFPLGDANGASQTIASVVSLPLGEKERQQGTLVMLIKDTQIAGLLQQINLASKGAVYMISRTGDIMMSTAGERSLPEGMQNAIAGESGSSVFKSADRTYMLSYTTGQDGWKIVSLVPEDVVFGRVNEIKTLALILLALALIAGAGAAYWMAYRSYSPLRDIVAALRRDRAAEEQTGANEYEFIRTTIDRTMLEERESKQKLAEMMPVARAHFLSRLLKGQAASSDLRTDVLQLNGLEFPAPYLYVIVIELEENGRFQVDANEHDRVLARFILLNVAVEISAGHGYVTETDRNRFVLLLGAATRDSAHEQRDSLIATMKRFMEERFQMKLAMATSSVREGLGEAANCYDEALQALDYRILHDARTVIHFEELQRREETIYFYPVELEVRLINLMKSGDYEQAAAILDELYEQNILSRGVTPELGKFLFFDMLSTLLKVIHALQIDGRQWFDGSDQDPVRWIAGGHSSEETMGRIKQLCRQMCDYVLESRIDPSARLKERMREYIERNFADSALSLNSIADQFGMTPSYISGIFKKQFGINLSDYLVQLRVDRAKRHLADSEMTIQQIAESVGYTTDIGFIRAFKKIEGVPPGKYRETLLQAGYLKSD